MSNKKVTKSSKKVQAKKVNEDARCPECKRTTGTLVNTTVEAKKVIKSYKCIFPTCGCEYDVEEAHEGTYIVETGEDMWKSGGMQVL